MVVMSMADHATRNAIQKWTGPTEQGNGTSSVCGVLLGQVSGNIVSVTESFEVAYVETKEALTIDWKNAENDLSLYREVYPDCEVLGLI